MSLARHHLTNEFVRSADNGPAIGDPPPTNVARTVRWITGKAGAINDIAAGEAMHPGASAVALASQQRLSDKAAMVGLLMRHTVNLGVAVITLVDPGTLALPAGIRLFAAVACWSLYRLQTRSRGTSWLAVDYALVLAVCLAIPALAPTAAFYTFNTAPQAIAGTAVISISVSVSVRASVPMTLGIAAAYAVGAAEVTGWSNLTSVAALYYFAIQCATASIIRYVLLRVADAIDQAQSQRAEAELNQRVTDAIRDYEHEQLALLHDTAASTLLVVGQGAPLPAWRLAAQARRDLELLREGAWVAPPPRVELVGALRDCAKLLSTPSVFDGHEQMWLAGETAHPVIAAAREAMNNVDRHAAARLLHVTVSDTSVRLADDGIGFDTDASRHGHGIDDSIIGRMARANGRAEVSSTPGSGTVTQLFWAATPVSVAEPPSVDPDRLIDRTRTRYGLAITVYALVNLAFTVQPGDVALGLATAVATLAAIPGTLYQRWNYAWPAAFVVLAVAIVQPALLPQDALLGYQHWAQGAVGWCVLPLLLALPTRLGATVIVGYWLINSAVTLFRDPSPAILVNIGLGSASILGVQLFALVFNGLMRDAAAEIHAENETRQRLLTHDRISQALRTEYQRRYAKIVGNVVPLLDALSRSGHVDRDMQMRARAECRRLRALFDQTITFDHPLMQKIRPLIDDAENRHIDVVMDVTGALPDLDDTEIANLVSPLGEVLDQAATSARVVLEEVCGQVEISVVVDTIDAGGIPDVGNAEITVSGCELWCVIRSVTPGPQS